MLSGMFTKMMLVLALAGATLAAADVSGKWDFAVETGAGGGTPVFTFVQSGEKLTGEYSGVFGTAKLTGSVKGDKIEFQFEANLGDQKTTVQYSGAVEGGTKMKGTVKFGALGDGTFTGTKK